MAATMPVDRLRRQIRIKNPLIRNLISEFFGLFMLLFIGLSIVMQFLFTHMQLNTWMHINLGWGFAICFCAHMLSHTSGGHMNPAVSFMFWTMGQLKFTHFILYSIAQTIGAFFAAWASYLLYYDQFQKYAGDLRTITGPQATAICFCSFPEEHVTHWTAFADQIIGTATLTLFVCVIIDKRNKVPHIVHPLYVGFILFVIGCAFGMNVGYPINPARDIGPRMFAYFLYGSEVFSHHSYYFWIPFVAPFFGSVLGGWTYHFFVGAHIPDEEEEMEKVEGESQKSEQKKLLL